MRIFAFPLILLLFLCEIANAHIKFGVVDTECEYILNPSRSISPSERLKNFEAPETFSLDMYNYKPGDFIKPTPKSVAMKVVSLSPETIVLAGPHGLRLLYSTKTTSDLTTFKLIETKKAPVSNLEVSTNRQITFGESNSLASKPGLLSNLEAAISNAEQAANQEKPLELDRLKNWNRLIADSDVRTESLVAGTLRGEAKKLQIWNEQNVLVDSSSHEVGDFRTNHDGKKQSIYIYAPPENVTGEVGQWLARANLPLSSTLEALRLARDFIVIHPFSVANGRVAAVAYFYLCKRNGLEIAETKNLDLIYDNLGD